MIHNSRSCTVKWKSCWRLEKWSNWLSNNIFCSYTTKVIVKSICRLQPHQFLMKAASLLCISITKNSWLIQSKNIRYCSCPVLISRSRSLQIMQSCNFAIFCKESCNEKDEVSKIRKTKFQKAKCTCQYFTIKCLYNFNRETKIVQMEHRLWKCLK